MFFQKKILHSASRKHCPTHDGRKFYNPVRFNTLCWKNIRSLFFLQRKGKWPRWIPSQKQLLPEKRADHVDLTFINHSSFFARFGDKNLLFDPIFSRRMGHSWFGIKRRRAPGISLDHLEQIDAVLISHNHYDHLDLPSLRQLQARFAPKIFVPLGDQQWLEKKGFKNVHELGWWESAFLSADLQIHFLPAQHSSGRGLFDQDRSLWGSFLVEHPQMTLFHAGDTGYSEHLQKIGQKFSIDVALLPIGASKPSWVLHAVHMDPFDAMRAHIDLGAKHSYAMHFDTFRLSSLHHGEAEKELEGLLPMLAEKDTELSIPEAGSTYHIKFRKKNRRKTPAASS